MSNINANANASQPRIQFSLRPATESDLPSCHAIYRHYALHTTIAFLLHDPPLKYISDRYHAAQSHELPYLVAVAATAATDPHPPNTSQPSTASSTAISATNEILGFTHALPFSGSKAGYAPSVEITLFCAPDRLGLGVGSALLTRLLAELGTCRNVHWEEGHEGQKLATPVRNVFAVVSQDLGRCGARGEEIVQWYCARFGFVVAGRLEGVGWKFGREVDVLYLQKRLG